MFSKKNLVEKHQEVSKDAFSLFEDTIKKLDDADIFIQEDIDVTYNRIENLKYDKQALEYIQTRNANLSARIKELLGM